MALGPVRFRPGIYSEVADEDAIDRWKYGNNVRFRKGYPQKRGGSQKEGPNSFVGTCRGLLQWVTLDDRRFVGLGTSQKLYIWEGGAYNDITPYRETGTLTNPVATTDTSAVVTITDASHGLQTGDTVVFSGGTFPYNNITLSGAYIVTVIDTSTYTVTAGTNANATGTGGGGSLGYSYEITIGETTANILKGWGTSTWNTARESGLGWNSPADISTATSIPRTWYLDKWGEDLIANYRGGAIYAWDASVGTGTRAALISGAPATARCILVSPLDRHLVVGGAHDGSDDDPLLIRWSAQEDYTDFTPSALNDAGDKRLDVGNEILAMITAGTQILVLTDEGAVGMYFVGLPDVFGFKTLGKSCGIIAPHAAAEANGVVYWFGRDGFYMYDGVVRKMVCDVHSQVFENINMLQKDKICASVVSAFDEIWWIFPSADSDENDTIVVYNYAEKIWWMGTTPRTAMLDKGEVVSTPIATSADGFIYNHETGYDDGDTAITATLKTYDFMGGSGEWLMLIRRIVPNFKTLIGTVNFYVESKKYPQSDDEVVTKGPFPVISTTKKFHPRARGREHVMKIESTAQGAFWRMGDASMDVKQDGKR